MKILKLSIEGLQNLKSRLEIDFVAQQRVDDDNRAQMFNVFSNIYINSSMSFIGINASGKTTILKLISFAIGLLNNEPINNIPSKEFLNDLDIKKNVIFTAYFYHDDVIYKLKTLIEKEVNSIDGNTKFVIADEMMWSKGINKVKTKKSLYDFNDVEVKIRRNKDEQYLMDDVSIIVALNKKQNTNFFLCDMSEVTDYNLLKVLGQYPKEILTFLDPSIENLSCEPDEKKVDIRLKFYGKDEINLNSPLALNKYLSSGTIKGLSVFMGAVFSFLEGGYLIVDELENHFNREIVSTLVRFFMDKKVNKKGATLIFSTHYSELLDEFKRNDSIYIVKNQGGITAENLSNILKRNDIKKSEIYDSDYLEGTVPAYESYIALKKALISLR
ncbi:MAG: ATP-binding protein [Lachnospiraceae bacterium]|nr:ATP-binding protein [Lachnospiraceae bacterium]